jgi:hypothetical protein
MTPSGWGGRAELNLLAPPQSLGTIGGIDPELPRSHYLEVPS